MGLRTNSEVLRQRIKPADRMTCNVMISGYWTDLYAKRLRPPKWRTNGFRARTRGGTVMEWLWMNYPAPTELHDYRYIGGSFPRRWRIHKRQRSWLRMLDRMPEIERRAMIAALIDKYGDAVRSYLRVDAAGHSDELGEPAGAMVSTTDQCERYVEPIDRCR